MTTVAISADVQHGRCAFCSAPLCFGPYECCAMFGQHTAGALVVGGKRLAGLDVCAHPQCALLARTSERLTLDRLVDEVAAQLLAVPLPREEPGDVVRLKANDIFPPPLKEGDALATHSIQEWARERARNIIAALQPDLRITPVNVSGTKPVGHGWSCRCRECGPVDDMSARRP